MNHIELRIDGETCRLSWATGDGIEKVQAPYVVESFKQVMMGAGFQPETINRVFNFDETNTGDNK